MGFAYIINDKSLYGFLSFLCTIFFATILRYAIIKAFRFVNYLKKLEFLRFKELNSLPLKKEKNIILIYDIYLNGFYKSKNPFIIKKNKIFS